MKENKKNLTWSGRLNSSYFKKEKVLQKKKINVEQKVNRKQLRTPQKL